MTRHHPATWLKLMLALLTGAALCSCEQPAPLPDQVSRTPVARVPPARQDPQCEPPKGEPAPKRPAGDNVVTGPLTPAAAACNPGTVMGFGSRLVLRTQRRDGSEQEDELMANGTVELARTGGLCLLTLNVQLRKPGTLDETHTSGGGRVDLCPGVLVSPRAEFLEGVPLVLGRVELQEEGAWKTVLDHGTPAVVATSLPPMCTTFVAGRDFQQVQWNLRALWSIPVEEWRRIPMTGASLHLALRLSSR